MKIVVTGGHHNSALALVRELKKKTRLDILWLGHRHAAWGDRSASAEYQEVTAEGILFVDLKAGKLYKTFHPLKFLRIPVGFLQAHYWLLRFRPDVVVSFGGYLAVPVTVAARLLSVLIVTHEQTTTVGWANRLISRLADRIFITWPASARHFPTDKTVLTGLPLRKAIFRAGKTKVRFGSKLPTIYVTGGKQGSHVINQAVRAALPQLLKDYNLIHQAGTTTTTGDLTQLRQLVEELPKELSVRYVVRGYIFEDEIGAVFSQADLVIGRAGAHTVYELAALKKPALLVPIPWVSHNEQYKSARLLVNLGMARILPEDELSPARLIKEVAEMVADLPRLRTQAEQARRMVRLDAAPRMAREIIELVRSLDSVYPERSRKARD